MGESYGFIISEEIKPTSFTYESFIQCIRKLGVCSSLEVAYSNVNESNRYIVLGEIKYIHEKLFADVLKIDIQEEACDNDLGKIFGLFAFKHAVTEVQKLKLKVGDFIAFQAAFIEKSPCYFIPPDYHNIHARISDALHLQTKIWFMRKPVTESPGTTEYRTMPKYVYHKLSSITTPRMPVHIYGIVVSVKEPSHTSNGKLMVRVGLIDDTVRSVEQPFELYIYCGSDEVAPKVEKYQVLRAHRVKVELFNDKLDGRVFKSADIVTVSSDVSSRDSVCSTAKTFQWTENDKARVRELYNWMWAQTWYRVPLSSNTMQHMIEDIKEPGLIKLYCKIVAVRISRDGECIVLTVCDGTVCAKHTKKILDVESKQLADILSEDFGFHCDQLEVDVLVTHVTDEFKLLKVGDFVCVIGVEVKTVTSKSTDNRLLLSLTMNARCGSLHTFEPQHSVAKRIERRLSTPKEVDERLERIESDRNLISLQDITNSSLTEINQSAISRSPVRTLLYQNISQTKKRSENELQVQVSCVNKKFKFGSDDTKRTNSGTSPYFSNVEKNCKNLFSTSCIKNDNNQVVNEPDPKTSKVCSIEKNTPVLTFSIGNGAKVLQSLERKIIEKSSHKSQVPSPSKTITEQSSVKNAGQGGEQMNCVDLTNNIECIHARSKNVCSLAKNFGVKSNDLIGDTLERELRIIFGEYDEPIAQEESNNENDTCPPEKNRVALSVPLNNEVIAPSSECTSSAGTYSQFCSKVTQGVRATSTQIVESCDNCEKTDLQPEKQGNKLQKIMEEGREESEKDNCTTAQKNIKCCNVHHPVCTNDNYIGRSSSVQHIKQAKCSQSREESQNLFSTYNSHPHYCTNMLPSVVENNCVDDVSICSTHGNEVNTEHVSKTSLTLQKKCKELDTLHSQRITNNVVQTCKGTACANISSTSSMNAVEINNVGSDVREAQSDGGNSQSWCQVSEETFTVCAVQKANSSKPSDQRKAVGGNCEINNVQTEVNGKDDDIQHLRSTSGNVFTKSKFANDTTEESEIPCFQVHQQSINTPKPSDTKSCIVRDTRSGLNCTSPNSFVNIQRDKEKVKPSKPCLCETVRHQKVNVDCMAASTWCLSMGVSPSVKTIVVCGWIVDIEPSLSGPKEDLVSGYCTVCNRIKRFSRVKKFVSKQGEGLCLHCYRKGIENVLALMFFFTLKVVIKSGRLFNIMVGHNPACDLFEFTLEDYISDDGVQTLARNYLKKMIVSEKADRIAKNRLECSILFDFEDDVYTLKNFIYLPVGFMEFMGRFL